jgi:hypothetical protein
MAKTLRPWSHVQPLEAFQREIDELFSRLVFQAVWFPKEPNFLARNLQPCLESSKLPAPRSGACSVPFLRVGGILK